MDDRSSTLELLSVVLVLSMSSGSLLAVLLGNMLVLLLGFGGAWEGWLMVEMVAVVVVRVVGEGECGW